MNMSGGGRTHDALKEQFHIWFSINLKNIRDISISILNTKLYMAKILTLLIQIPFYKELSTLQKSGQNYFAN